jgi:Holliday junction resolvase
MALTPERKVKVKVLKELASLGAYTVLPVTGGFGNSGVPDILCCYKGLFIGIECKAQGGKPTALQLSNLKAIEDAGGYSFVVDETNMNNVGVLIQSLRS